MPGLVSIESIVECADRCLGSNAEKKHYLLVGSGGGRGERKGEG